MAWASAIKGGYYQQDQETFLANAEIVDIDEKKFDLFQEVFSEDYIKIALVIKEKKKKTAGVRWTQSGVARYTWATTWVRSSSIIVST